MKKVTGKGLYLSIYDETATAYYPLACLTSNGISENQDVTESDPNKCEDTTSFSYGPYSYEMNAEGQFLDPTDTGSAGKGSYDWLHAKMKANRTAKKNLIWKETTTHEDGTFTYRYGEGIITTLDLTAEAEGDATFSLTIQGVGEIVTVDPTEPEE